ncbi:MAG: molybdopterin oxidoreductase family protein [Alphaproteobacteria bacterium]|nr:molybdopterin oxidoreductase family protein [Alphaproteobacteria bacterium]
MNQANLAPSVCPHDCPSACGLMVERLADGRIGRVHGAKMPYIEGVICAKVARYAERVHHPDRVTTPLRRVGPKGAGAFAPIGWDEALDEIADRFRQAAAQNGAESVWPYFYAGTMGLVQQNALNRLRRAMGYSGQAKTICASAAGAGWMAGVGAKWGVDAREMAESDLIVIWGANPVATQVHLMGLINQARKQLGAKLVVIDPYRSGTAEKADTHLMLRPGTDGALAVAVMHVLFREGLVDRGYVERYTEGADRLEAHVATRTPAWAAAITGLSEAEIEAFARAYGTTKRSLIRLGYGMSRSRNGAVNLHAASCLPALTGAWEVTGGGAIQSASGGFAIERTLIDAADLPEPKVRTLDMSRIGAVLDGDPGALAGGPQVAAMLVQSTNPATVAPETDRVWRGLARDDLFVAVHEQAMTQTARFADIVLPATTFLEHADLYTSYGHSFLQVARPVIDPVGQARSNHWVVGQLAQRLGAVHPSFAMDDEAMVAGILAASGLPDIDAILAAGWHDCTPSFDRAHFLTGFGHGGRFRFAPDWAAIGPDHARLPALPDHAALTEATDALHPFRLITPPSRHFLNSTFADTASSQKLAGRPTVLIHAQDCRRLRLADGQLARLGNQRGSVVAHVAVTEAIAPGTVAVEGIWRDESFVEGIGINRLVGGDPIPPAGGAAFHDTAIWVRGEA